MPSPLGEVAERQRGRKRKHNMFRFHLSRLALRRSTLPRGEGFRSPETCDFTFIFFIVTRFPRNFLPQVIISLWKTFY